MSGSFEQVEAATRDAEMLLRGTVENAVRTGVAETGVVVDGTGEPDPDNPLVVVVREWQASKPQGCAHLTSPAPGVLLLYERPMVARCPDCARAAAPALALAAGETDGQCDLCAADVGNDALTPLMATLGPFMVQGFVCRPCFQRVIA